MENWKALAEYNWVLWVAGFFALAEFFRWLFSTKDWFCQRLGIETKKMREAKELRNRLKNAEESIVEIKDTAKKNVDMFLSHEKQAVEQFVGIRDEIVVELNKLHTKLDKQQIEIEKNNEASAKTDCTMLRDRIIFYSSVSDAETPWHVPCRPTSRQAVLSRSRPSSTQARVTQSYRPTGR